MAESGCVYSLCVEEREELRAKIARLEAANTTLATALERIALRAESEGHGSYWAIASIARAALSDTAGEGWLPPEVREQDEL